MADQEAASIPLRSSCKCTPNCKSAVNDVMFKVVLCGENGVGKTAIFHRLKDDKFYDEESHTSTAGECTLTVSCNNNVEIKIYLCDTAGMETYASLTRSYFHSSHLVVIVYSADKEKSLSKASEYLTEAKRHAPGATIALVQNKIDLPEGQKQQAEKNEFKFNFKTSAKTGEGVKEMMQKLGTHLHKHTKQTNRSSVFQCSHSVDVAGCKARHNKCCSRK